MTPGAAMACARGIGICLVVLYHADVDLAALFVGYQKFFGVVGALQYVAVPTFLICAGLAMSGRSRSTPYLAGEATNYFYIYLVWVAISLVLTATVDQANIPIPASPRSFIRTIVLPASPLWFPYGLALMLGSAALTTGATRNVRLGIAFAIGFVPLLPSMQRTAVIAVCSNVFIFYVGLLFRSSVFRVLTRPALPSCVVATAAYAALLVASVPVGLVGVPMLYDALSLLGFWALVSFWRLVGTSFVSRFFAKLGRAALPILVMHDFCLHVGERLLLWITGGHVSARWEFLLPASLSVFALAACLVLLQLIGRVSPVFSAPHLLTDGSTRLVARMTRMSSATVQRLRAPRPSG